MDELSELIATFKDQIFALPDPLLYPDRFPPADTPQFLDAIMANVPDVILAGQQLTYNTRQIACKLPSIDGSPETSLAVRLIPHDLNNFLSVVRLFAEQVAENPFLIENSQRMEDYLYSTTNMRLTAIAMAYLATPAEQRNAFETEVPLSLLPRLLKSSIGLGVNTIWELHDGSVTAPTYTSVYQIVKNSKYSFSLKAEPWGAYGVLLSYADGGSGLLDELGQPLPQERVHEIFGNFSSRQGGGLGLQVVKALIHSQGGSIYVQSRTQDGPTVEYHSRPSGENQPSRGERSLIGTTFTLYQPSRELAHQRGGH